MPNADRASARSVRSSRTGRPELGALFDEVVRLYLKLTRLAATMYKQGELSGPRRTLLMALARSGPQTVSHLARARAQSRQRLQPLVNALIQDGLLTTEANPLHKQSPLVVVTPRGQKRAQEIAAREGALRDRLRLPISRRRLVESVAVLREVRESLEQHGADLLRDEPRAGRRVTLASTRSARPARQE